VRGLGLGVGVTGVIYICVRVTCVFGESRPGRVVVFMGLGRGPLGVTQRGPSCVISRARDWVVSRVLRVLVGHVGYVGRTCGT
jgi:hypothetical protein